MDSLFGVEEVWDQRRELVPKAFGFPVNLGAVQPFVQREVAGREQPEALPQIPAGEVQVVWQHQVDNVAVVLQFEIPVPPMRIDEAKIVVAVWGRESPSAAAGFASV